MENNKTPKIRFKGFNETWEQRELGEIATEILAGGDVDKYLLADKGKYPVIANALTNDGIVGYYEEQYRIKSPALTVTGRGDVGHAKARIVDFTPVVRLLSVKSNHDVFFLENAINNLTIVVESTGVPQLTVPQLRKYKISYPTNKLEEEAIGKFFVGVDNLITLHQRKYDNLISVKKSMLEKMFPKSGAHVPKIRFKGFTETWEQRELGDMGSTFTGLSGKTKEDFGHGGAKFITYMNVFSNPIADLQMTEKVEIDTKQNCVKEGDVFFTTSSETPEEVGMSCVMPRNADNIYLNSFCFGYRPTENFDLNYLAYVLRSNVFRKEMIFLAQGISRYNISKNKVMEVKISVPSFDEQEKVGSYFSNLDNLITLHQRKLEMLKNIKKSMLDKLFI